MSEADPRQQGFMAMRRQGLHPHIAWGPVQRASFGLIYGSILVLSLVMVIEEVLDGPFEAALVLFGSVLAVTLAKIFAEVLSHAMETGECILTAKAFRAAWQRRHSTLLVANVPTAIFIAARLGWLDVAAATGLTQLFCVVVLVILGARVGWVINHSWWLPIGETLFAGSVGSGVGAPDGTARANIWTGILPVLISRRDGFAGIAPVGCFERGPTGAYDMIGNVWEWTDSPFAPAIPRFTIKGGSYFCSKIYCQRYRVAARESLEHDFSTAHIGFRIVQSTNDTDESQ